MRSSCLNWIILVIIATVFDSIRIFIDNYTSDVYFKENGAVSQKLFYGYAYILIAIIISIITGFDFIFSNFLAISLIFLSGILSSISGIPYYKALEIDDSTNIGIFIQLAPILYLILGWLFLGETISITQFISFFIILSAPLLIILTSRKRSRKTKLRAIILAFLYIFIAVSANLIFVKANTESLNFVNEIAILFLGKGVANLFIIYSCPKWHKRFKTVLKSSKKKVLAPLISNTLIGVVKDFAYRGALVAAPAVALASAASDSTEPIVIFFMGLVLTLIWPKFGREKLNKKSVLVHLVATILAVSGVVLLQF